MAAIVLEPSRNVILIRKVTLLKSEVSNIRFSCWIIKTECWQIGDNQFYVKSVVSSPSLCKYIDFQFLCQADWIQFSEVAFISKQEEQ